MSEHLTLRQSRRLDEYERLINELLTARSWIEASALEDATAGLLESDLDVEEFASAVAGLHERKAPDGHRCSHRPDEFAGNALACPEHHPWGECCECPF